MSEQEKKRRGRPKKAQNTGTKVPASMKIDNSTDVNDATVSEVVKHKRPGRSELYKPKYEPGQMSNMLINAMALRKMGEVDMTDPKAVEQRVDEYITFCIERDMKPTVESMALAFGTNRTQLWRWKEGVDCGQIPEATKKALKRGYDLMNDILAQTLVDGSINPIAAFFLLKNNHGYKDQTDVVVQANTPYGGMGTDDIRGKYLEGMQHDIPVDGEVK